jgi:hypothetical protein
MVDKLILIRLYSAEMENQTNSPVPTPPAENVGFPNINPSAKKNSFPILLVIIPIFILILGGLAYFVFRGSSSTEDINSSPQPQLSIAPTPEESISPTPTATPAALNKKDIKVTVLNGTGIPGEAAYLQGVLKSMGFTQIDTTNSDTSDASNTVITYNYQIPQANIDELTNKLKDIYKGVDAKSSRTLDTNVIQITTGFRKSATPTPSVTPSPTASATPSATPTATPVPSL